MERREKEKFSNHLWGRSRGVSEFQYTCFESGTAILAFLHKRINVSIPSFLSSVQRDFIFSRVGIPLRSHLRRAQVSLLAARTCALLVQVRVPPWAEAGDAVLQAHESRTQGQGHAQVRETKKILIGNMSICFLISNLVRKLPIFLCANLSAIGMSRHELRK